MLDLKQVVLARKSTSPDPQYFLEITATDQVHGFPEIGRAHLRAGERQACHLDFW